MWIRWSKLEQTCASLAHFLVIALYLTALPNPKQHPARFWIMLVLLFASQIFIGLYFFRARRKQRKKWENMVRRAPGIGWRVESEIQRRPTGHWAWTFTLSVCLLYRLSADKAKSVSFHSDILFWLLFIAFLCSVIFLFVETIVWRSFGSTCFQFESAFSPGGKIVGGIHFEGECPRERDLVSRVECHVQGTGDEVPRTLWSSERRISSKEFAVEPTNRRYIPIEFDLPSSALESSDLVGDQFSENDTISWKLTIKPAGSSWLRISKGKLRAPYEDRFPIPVFRVEQPSVPGRRPMDLRILSGPSWFAANQFGKKRKERDDPLRAFPGIVLWSKSGIHRPPVRGWVWATALFVLLLSRLWADNAGNSSFSSDTLFWLLLIAFLFSAISLFGKVLVWRDFGKTYFHFDSAFSPGGKIAGRIHFQRDGHINYALISRIECFRAYRRAKVIRTVWFSEQQIPPKEFGIGPTGRRYIPIDFDLPSSALESSDGEDERIFWELTVRPAESSRRGTSEAKLRARYLDRFKIWVLPIPSLRQNGMAQTHT